MLFLILKTKPPKMMTDLYLVLSRFSFNFLSFFLLPHKILTKFFQVELTASMESLEQRHGLIAAASSALMKAYDQMPNFD